MATITGSDGMVKSQGHNDNFFDGGATARLTHLGAMGETKEMNGPSALNISGAQNKLTGHTAAAPAGIGTGG